MVCRGRMMEPIFWLPSRIKGYLLPDVGGQWKGCPVLVLGSVEGLPNPA